MVRKTRQIFNGFWKVFAIFSILLSVNTNVALAKYPEFGHPMREEFLFNPGYISLNHGSYGTYPKSVRAALHTFQDRAEANADLWVRRDVGPALISVRAQLAALINCDEEDLVAIPNTTSGMNAIFRSMFYVQGDKILHFSNVYYAMGRVIQFASDYSQGNVTGLKFPVQFPISNAELIAQFEEFIQDNLPIRIALVDHISSTPSIVQPIEQLITILRKYNISVLIDGAHAIGQVPIDIKALEPDYYITNCHKWLYAARGCSMMYVRKSLQGTVHPASISSSYAVPANFQAEFGWTGTIDYSPYLTVSAALEFRRDVGGEEAIREYTHNLAIEGGELLAKKFGTRILQVEEAQIGSMIDVELPLANHADPAVTQDFWVDSLLYRFNFYVATYREGGKWWIRASAQIYNDLSDFEKAGEIMQTLCDEINSGTTQDPSIGWSSTSTENSSAGSSFGTSGTSLMLDSQILLVIALKYLRIIF